jgi:cation transporter-like permease
MFQESTVQAIRLFPLIMGGLAILLGLFGNRLSLAFGLKPMSERFTNPRFQRSAKVTELLGRLLLVVIGAGFLVEGAGRWLFSAEVVGILSTVLLVSSLLIPLVIIVVVIVHWRA